MALSRRKLFYTIGLTGLIVAAVMGGVGMGAPGWLILNCTSSAVAVRMYYGLWEFCNETDSTYHCWYSDYDSLGDFERATQAMTCIGMGLLVIASLCGLLLNGTAHQRFSPVLEASTLAGGIFMFVGCMVWLGYKQKHHDAADASYGYPMIITAMASITAIITSFFLASGHNGQDSFQHLT